MEIGKKLLFFDVDGTLAMIGQKVSDSTKEALQKAQKNGHKIFLSTGRGESGIAPDIDAIGFDGGIYHAGSMAIVNGKKVLDHVVPKEVWHHAMDLVDDLLMQYSIDCNVAAYKNKTYSIDELYERFHVDKDTLRAITCVRSKPFSEYRGQDIYKIVILCESTENMNEVKRRLQGIAKVMSYETFTGDADIVHGDVNFGTDTKATGLYAICDALGVSTEDCIAFGDGMNDYEIIRAAGLGIAMGNGDDEIKRLADRVCESCEDDGIAKELERLGLI